MQNKNKKIIFKDSQASVGYNRFHIGCVFVEYDLFISATFVQNSLHMNFGVNLIQFYINFSRQEHQIDVLYVSFSACEILRFHSIYPF